MISFQVSNGSSARSAMIDSGKSIAGEHGIDWRPDREWTRTLDLSRRLEPFHDSLSSSSWLMRIFGSVIEALVLPVFDPRHHFPLGRSVAFQLSVMSTRGALADFLNSLRMSRLAAARSLRFCTNTSRTKPA